MGASPLSPHIQDRLDRFRELGGVTSALICLGMEEKLEGSDEEREDSLREILDSYSKEVPVYLPESTAAGNDPVRRAEKDLRLGYPTHGLRLKMETPVNWLDTEDLSRNVRYKIQSWVVIDSILTADSESKEDRWFNPPLEFVKDWVRTFVVESNIEDFLWYDMAVGQRGTKIAYMIRRCMFSSIPIEDIAWMIVAAEIHMLELMEEEKLASHSNHGLFQMAGLLALGSSLPFIECSSKAVEFGTVMIRKMLAEHFTQDGLHKEHSPDYHIFMTNFVSLLSESGFMKDDSFDRLNQGAVEASYWMCQPDGNLVPFGDSKPVPIEHRAAFPLSGEGGHFSAPHGLKTFEEGGLVVHSEWKDGVPSNYLAFSASFHSRQHKHADDFTFQLFSETHGIITDPSTYTYQYDLKERIFAESTRAHNCLLIDDLNYSRFNADVFGSSIEGVQEVGDLVVIEARVHRNRLISETIPNNKIETKDGVKVDISHRRMLLYHPGKFLVVIDDVESPDEHNYSQCFQLYPEIELVREGSEYQLHKFINEEYKMVAKILPLSPSNMRMANAKGQIEPYLCGWISKNGHELEEASNIQLSTSGDRLVIATMIDLSPEQLAVASLKFNEDGKYIRFNRKCDVSSNFEFRQKGAKQVLTYKCGNSESEKIIE